MQEYLYLYGEATCLNLINLNYESKFFYSMATARSELSSSYCETLIKKGISRLKKLDLFNKVANAKKQGTFLIFTSTTQAIEELGESITLDMINQNLRDRIEKDKPIFVLSQISINDLELAKKRWTDKKYEKQWAIQLKKDAKKGIKSEGYFTKSNENSGSFFPTREETKGEKEDRERQERSRKEQQEAESIRREKEWEKEEKEKERNQIENSSGFVKRSLDTDPDDDLSPEIFQLDSLDERKLKNIEVKFDKDEE